ncbi:MAG: LytR/AlgR family response regulator transcription factor [Myxococcota bacterium]
MRTLVVDDEKPAREELTWMLDQIGDVEVVGQASDATEAREQLDKTANVDLVFLDIDMPGVGGMRLAESLSEMPEDARPMIAFVTAYDEYAVDAFDVDAVDYLLKPVRLERLRKAVDKARARLKSTEGVGGESSESSNRPLERISVEDRGVYRVVPIEDVLFFEAEDGVVAAATRNDRFITEFSLKFLEQNLSPGEFFRCHRSYIVRLDAIESIAPWGAGTYRLILSDDDEISVPLARSRANELKSRIPWSATVFED